MVKKIIMYLYIFFLFIYCRKEKEANAYAENFHVEYCKDRYRICFILRNHLVLERELIQLLTSIKIIHTI